MAGDLQKSDDAPLLNLYKTGDGRISVEDAEAHDNFLFEGQISSLKDNTRSPPLTLK